MNRKEFLKSAGLGSLALTTSGVFAAAADTNLSTTNKTTKKETLAITMWEFSWLERRWAGAGYEDWNVALNELTERGYNAVRIDPFPHLLGVDPFKEWTLIPVWNQQMWGSPAINKVTILPSLTTFIAACKKRNIKVGLSSWFREDADNVRMKITSPEYMADIWIKTLHAIEKEGLLDAILYVDLCNEWPGPLWAPYLNPVLNWGEWDKPSSMEFMKKSVALVRQQYPQLPLCYSFQNERVENYTEHDVSYFDLYEHHIWMAQENNDEYYKEVGYAYDRFTDDGYKNVVLKAEQVYRSRPEYWQKLLITKIDRISSVSRLTGKPLITTECWSLVDYKDWPLLKWDWLKELCALGVSRAAATGQWMAIATSNFCGPQFKGMWNDVYWHQQQTNIIKKAPIHEAIKKSLLYSRL